MAGKGGRLPPSNTCAPSHLRPLLTPQVVQAVSMIKTRQKSASKKLKATLAGTSFHFISIIRIDTVNTVSFIPHAVL